jgi:hypothetical protein
MVATVAVAGVAQAQTDQPETATPAAEPGTPAPTPELKNFQPPPSELPPCPPGEQPPPQAAAPAPAPAPMAHRTHYSKVFAYNSIGLVTGGGVANYFGSSINNIDTGPSWDARMIMGTRSVIALEAGYLGQTNEVNPNGVNAHVNSNGLDGTFRLQLPFRVQPYIFSGVGYQRMTLDNPHSDPAISARYATGDNQVTVPAGGGVAGYLGKHATIDLRGTYRYIGSNNMTIMSPEGGLNQWIAQARVGYVF